jgi:putative membrane protein
MVCALALTALPAAAQSSAGASGSSTSGSGRDTGNTSSGSATGTPGTMSGTAPGTTLTREETSLMTDLAQANIAEIETGRMALEKSQNPQVRKFAQQMIDDHTAAQQQLQALARTKGVTLTEETDLQHKTMATAMKVLTGETFDSQYLKRVGVNDHQRTIELLQKAQTNARDPDIKAMAAKMLPTVQAHLQMGRQMANQIDSAQNKSDKAGSR